MQLDNLLGNGQAQPRAYPCRLRRKKGIKNASEVFLRNSGAGIVHFGYHYRVANPERRGPAGAFEMARFGQLFEIGAHRQCALLGHGMNGIHENIDEDLLDLRFVHTHRREALAQLFDQ